MKMFKEWLLNKGFGKNTVNDYSSFIEKKFKLYLHSLSSLSAEASAQAGSIEELEHETLMQYIRHRKAEGIGAKTINSELKKKAIT